ncbi:hypothetical protein ACFQ0M_06160 [Kitasatospora aburaviensis]
MIRWASAAVFGWAQPLSEAVHCAAMSPAATTVNAPPGVVPVGDGPVGDGLVGDGLPSGTPYTCISNSEYPYDVPRAVPYIRT